MKNYLLLICLSALSACISTISLAEDVNTRIISLKTDIQEAGIDKNTDELRSELGQLYLQTGEYISAEKELNKIQAPSNEDLTNLARVYLLTLNTKAFTEFVASASFTSVVDKTTYSAFKAQSELLSGNKNTANSILKSISTKTDIVKLIEAKVLLQSEDYQQSIDSLKQVDENKYPESHLIKAEIYKNTGYLLQAIDSLKKYSRAQPKSTYHLPKLLQLQLVSEDFSAAKKTISKILKLQDKNTFALQADAIIALQENDYTKAYRTMEKIFSYISVPTEQQVYLMATSALKTKRYEIAIKYMERLKEIDSDTYNVKEIVDVLASRNFHNSLDTDKKSKKDLKSISKLYKVAILNISDGEVEKANEIASSLISDHPELPQGYYIESLVSLKNNDFSNAYISSLTAFKLSPYNPFNINNMVYLAEKASQIENALQNIDKKIAKAKVTDPVITLYIYRHRLEKDSSVIKLENYFEKTKDQNAALQLSLIYRDKGATEKAYSLLKEIYLSSESTDSKLTDSFIIEYSNVLKLLNKTAEADSFFDNLLKRGYTTNKFITAAIAFNLAYKKDSFNQFLSKWSEKIPNSPILLRAKIQKLIDNKKINTAYELFKNNEEKIINAPSGKITAGIIYNQTNDYEKSANYFNEEYEENPSEKLLLTTYRAFLIAKDMNKAHYMLKNGVKKYTNNRYIKALYAQSLIKRNKKLAIDVYLELLKEDSISIVYLNNLADLYNSTGDKKTALTYINRALSLKPENEALKKTRQRIESTEN